ncbi:MAG: hypothetical protein ACOCZC_00510 [Halodesulfurarchaeum sp.]
MRWDTPYFAMVGALLVAAGAIGTLAGLTGDTIHVGPVAIGGTFAIWWGPVLVGAGAFMLRAVSGRLTTREDEALVFMGSLMLWIVGGADVLSILLGAIPGGAEVWLASPAAFLAGVAPPYPPAVLGAFLALPAFRYAENDVLTILRRLLGRSGE